MLLFIPVPRLILPGKLHSNTSHVIVYPAHGLVPFMENYSNTSHVIVYRDKRADVVAMEIYSNTSHVIVYPSYLQPFLIQYTSKTFILQYISGILPAVCAVFQILHKRSKIPLFPSLLYIHVIKRLVKFIISGSLHFPHSHYLIFLLQIHCHS